jgi:hypothetical protein
MRVMLLMRCLCCFVALNGAIAGDVVHYYSANGEYNNGADDKYFCFHFYCFKG